MLIHATYFGTRWYPLLYYCLMIGVTPISANVCQLVARNHEIDVQNTALKIVEKNYTEILNFDVYAYVCLKTKMKLSQ